MPVRLKWVLLAMAAGAAAGLGALWVLPGRGGPQLQVESRVVELGRVNPGGTARGRIWIGNSGSDVLRVESLRVGCNCGHVSIDKSAIAPGERAQLSIAMHGTGLGESSQSTVYLVTNDPFEPVAAIVVRVGALTGIRVEPGVLDFGRVLRQAMPVTRQVTICTDGEWASSSSPWCREGDQHLWAKTVARADRRGITVVATLLPTAPCGQYRSEVVVAVNANTTVTIPVHATIRGEVFADPPALVIGPLKRRTQGIVATVKVVRRSGPLNRVRVVVPESLALVLQCQALEPDTIGLLLRTSDALYQRAEGSLILEAEGPGLPAELLSVPVIVLLAWSEDKKGSAE